MYEKVERELKAGFAFDGVSTMRYAPNSVWQLLSVVAFNVMRGFQVIMTAGRRSPMRKRGSLPRFETIHILRYVHLYRAGLVLYSGGRRTLDVGSSVGVRCRFQHVESQLMKVA